MPIRLCVAASLTALLTACATPQTGPARLDADCQALQAACNAQCERDFETSQNAWDYQSCIDSCRPSERSQCRASDIGY